MTTIPKPADPTHSFMATYDAWHRLARLTEGMNTIAEYDYDGATRRLVTRTHSGGLLTSTRRSFYTDPSKWQVIEERLDSASGVDRHFIWGLRYIDDLAVRDRDSNGSGQLGERHYCLQDSAWNVVSIANSAGHIDERYVYSPYGQIAVCTPTFVSRAASAYSWDVHFSGHLTDTASWLCFARHRHYSPLTGWLQRDPLTQVAGTHLYEYAKSNPLVYTDPLGLLSCKSFEFSPCNTALFGCLCFLASLADLAPKAPRWIAVLDCLCGVITTIQKSCMCESAIVLAPWVFLDCLAGVIGNIVDLLVPGLGTAVTLILEVIMFVMQSAILLNLPGGGANFSWMDCREAWRCFGRGKSIPEQNREGVMRSSHAPGGELAYL